MLYYVPTPLPNYRYYSQAGSQNSAVGKGVLRGSEYGAPSARKLCNLGGKNNYILGLFW